MLSIVRAQIYFGIDSVICIYVIDFLTETEKCKKIMRLRWSATNGAGPWRVCYQAVYFSRLNTLKYICNML